MTAEALPAGWREAALGAPRAWGEPPAAGQLRSEASDFRVEERLGFEPDGGGQHLLLLVEKENANTLFVARTLAALAGCGAAEIGFAGLKDRRAVARQWFTVPASRRALALAGHAGEGFRVLASHPHSRKLRRGALAANRFVLRLRRLEGDRDALEARAREVAERGTPNYFGEQRFGVGGANLARVARWAADGRLPRVRERRAFVLSAARALCFNRVLGARVAAGTWNLLLPGEVAALAGSRTVFPVRSPDPGLEQRLASGDVGPTGPMPGVGGVLPAVEAAAVEEAALAALAPVPARLAGAGVRAERRPLVLRPRDFAWRIGADELELEFELPPGAFATSLVRELVATSLPEDDAE